MQNIKETQTLNSGDAAKFATVDLSNCARDGRSVLGRCTSAARMADVPKDDILNFFEEAISKDFDALLALVFKKFDVTT